MVKFKRFIRRWRLCRTAPYIRKPGAMTWTPTDGTALHQFLTSDTGIKVLTALDDVVFNAVFKGSSSDIVEGMVDMKQYIMSLATSGGGIPVWDDEDETGN